MSTTAFDMASLLVLAGKGINGTDLFTNVMPEVKECVAVFDIPTQPPVYAMGLNPVHQFRYVQIQSRHEDPAQAALRCQDCLTALTQFGVAVNGRTYEMIRPRSSAMLLTRDQNNLTVFYGEVECVLDLG